METTGRLVMLTGAILIAIGFVLTIWTRVPLIGKLPGDFHFKLGNMNVYFPLATSILLSVILTLLLRYFGRR